MFSTLNMCLLILVVMVGALVALVYVAVRKVKVGEISQADVNQLMPNLDYAFRMRGWQSKWNANNGKMTVTKDSLVASDIYFRVGASGNTEILSGVNAGTIGWVLVIVFMFISGGLIGIVLAIVLHIMSRNFAQNDLVPVIMYVHSNPPVYPQYRHPQYGEQQITLKSNV
jgi:hypothetical protein